MKDFLIRMGLGMLFGGTVLALIFGFFWLLANYGTYALLAFGVLVFGFGFYQLGDVIVQEHRIIRRRQQRAREIQT